MEYIDDNFVDNWLIEFNKLKVFYKNDINTINDNWLNNYNFKKAIFAYFYKSLFQKQNKIKIADIAGGFSGFSEYFQNNHFYELYEIFAHPTNISTDIINRGDWYKNLSGEYDLIICNDFFPNVDQRLEIFLEKALPITKKLLLSLTYYPEDKFYVTKRVDADEVLTVLAWNIQTLSKTLSKYKNDIYNYDPKKLIYKKNKNLFGNDRNIILCEFKGEIK